MSEKKRKAPSAADSKEPSAKQPKLEKEAKAAGWLRSLVEQQREEKKKEMKFNKKRQRFLTDTEKIKQGSEGVLYWMQRDQRVQGEYSTQQSVRLRRTNNLYIINAISPPVQPQ